MIPTTASTAREITAVHFSFFTPSELRRTSVKQITDPLSFDTLHHPTPSGLYSPALGPLDKSDVCATCGLGYFGCPGHFGHVELAVPVFNPTVFSTMYRLLGAGCGYCHKLRTSRVVVG